MSSTSASITNVKESVYNKRKFGNGVPAPVEEDDSDFGRDPTPDPRPKKRRRTSGQKKGQKKSSSRKAVGAHEGLDDFLDDADNTGVDSGDESDSDPTTYFQISKRFTEADDDEDEKPDKERSVEPEQQEEDGDDESDGPSTASSPVARSMPVKKRPVAVSQEDDSATEPDEPMNVNSNSDDSQTESDDEQFSQISRRPNFELLGSHKRSGPLVLDSIQKIQVPSAINNHLRSYQRDGVQFFWDMYKDNRGGLLGDDMGLGKTIQVIAFLSAIMRKTGYSTDEGRRRKHVADLQDEDPDWRRNLPSANVTWPTALIIAPSSVAVNWEREFEKWGYFEVGMYTANPKTRASVLKDFKLGRIDVVITTFELARDDVEKLCDLAWSCVIVDEVHRVKNPRSRTTAKLNMFDCPVRFGLTGTAIQNNYMELWTILDWTNPGAFGKASEWKSRVVLPLTNGQSKDSTDVQRLIADNVARALTNVLLPKFFLRRTKDIIIDQLPKKTDKVAFCPLSDAQITVYKRFLGTPNIQNMLRRDEPCDCGSKKKRQKCCYPMDVADIFRYIATLLKISNHLALILPADTDSPEQKLRNREISRVAFNETIPLWGTAIYEPQYCGKWLVLKTLLKEWHKDSTNKVLIFTKSVKLLEILQFHVESQNWGFERLDGSTDQSERMPMIDRFHQNPNTWIFLISTLAGGTGLNLVGANKVVIFDPNWNPAHDLQAIDRAFRIGQIRDVEVFRFLAAGSIEELIYARQLYKQQQMKIGYEASVQTRYFEGVQNVKDKQGELFGLQNIFKLHEDLATKRAIEDAHLTDLDWALANMDTSIHKPLKDIRAADKKASELEGSEFSGLGAFLMEDDPAPIAQDKVAEALRNLGVEYSHVNDEVLRENLVEKTRLKHAQKVEKAQRKSKKDGSPLHEEWPPRRKHHQIPTERDRLYSRREALVGLGFVKDPEDLPLFAQAFVQKSQKEQQEIFAELDRFNKPSSDAIPSFVNPSVYRM